MLTRACAYIILLTSVSAFSQAVAPVTPAPAPGDAQMLAPPPVSGIAFPTEVGTEVSHNSLRGGVTYATAYIDNFYPGTGRAIAENTYSVLPTIDFDQTTPIRHIAVMYSPAFTIYQPTGELNEMDHSADLAYQVRLTPHTSLRVSDGFRYSSTSFDSLANGTVTGTAQPTTPGIMPPFGRQLTNNAEAAFTMQTSRNSMIGASGSTTTLHYPHSSELPGLYDSTSHGGSGFYARRISNRQYIGPRFDYADIVAHPGGGDTETLLQEAAGFYTLYPTEQLSLSLSAGAQKYRVNKPGLPGFSSWDPSVSASVGWQGRHTSLAAIYSQAVTGGGGLIGAFHSRLANATARWQISRTWIIAGASNYAINKTVSPLRFTGLENGHSVSGSMTVTRTITQSLSLLFEYDHLHASYGGVPAIANNPESNRASLSVSWSFLRQLGQ